MIPSTLRTAQTASDSLSVRGIVYVEGRRIAFWTERSRKRIADAKTALSAHLPPVLSRLCTHVRFHGGVKGTIRALH
jgi:hypothetical protein